MHLNHAPKLHFLRFLNINTPSKRSVPFCEELVTPVRFNRCPVLCWLGAMTQVPQRPRGGIMKKPRLVCCLGEKIGGDEKLDQSPNRRSSHFGFH